MSDNTSTTLDASLKDLYGKATVEDMIYKAQPAYAMVAKDETAGGGKIPLVVQYGNGQGRSGTFSKAQENASAELMTKFELDYKTDYDVATINGLAAARTKGDTKAFLEGMTVMIDGAFKNLGRSIGITMYRDGSGQRGRILSGYNTATITLYHASQVTNFEVNMQVEAASGIGTGVRNSAAATTILSLDRNAGTLTTTEAAWNTTITNLANDDYLYCEGDYGSTTTASSVMFPGFNGWVPSSAPSSTAFWGVDRSVDTRLSGQRYDGSSQLVEEALIDGQSVGSVEGALLDTCFVNHVKLRELIKAQGSKTQFPRGTRPAQSSEGDIARIGFRSVQIDGDHTTIDVIADINCPYNEAWMHQWENWKLYSVGPAPRLLDDDDNRVLRQASADGYEVRVGAYLVLGCSDPHTTTRITLAS